MSEIVPRRRHDGREGGPGDGDMDMGTGFVGNVIRRDCADLPRGISRTIWTQRACWAPNPRRRSAPKPFEAFCAFLRGRCCCRRRGIRRRRILSSEGGLAAMVGVVMPWPSRLRGQGFSPWKRGQASFITETGVVQASLRQVILLRAGGRIRKAGAVLHRKRKKKAAK